MSERPQDQDQQVITDFIQTHGKSVLGELCLRETAFDRNDLLAALAEQPEETLPVHLHRLTAAGMMRDTKLITRLGNGSLTSSALLAREKALDAAARKLVQVKDPLVTPSAYRKAMLALDAHYKAEKRDPDPSYTAAMKHMLAPGAIKLLEGPPGGQKSKMMHMLVEARRQSDPNGSSRTLVTADSDRVTATLAEGAQCEGAILDTVLAKFEAGETPLEPGGLLIVDEAAMLGTVRMASLLEGAVKHNLNVIMLGDSKQIPPRLAGHPFRYLTKVAPTAQLANTFRQRVADERQATVDLRNSNAADAVAVYANKGRVNFAEKRKATLQATVDAYVEHRVDNLHSPRSALMVGMSAKDAKRMNKWVREDLIAANVIGASQPVTVTGGKKLQLSMGDRILFNDTITPPNHDRPVYKGSAGFITRITGKSIDIVLDGKNPRAMRLSRKEELPLTHGYAIDLRRAQGLKADHIFMAVTEPMDASSGLVAFSRHKRSTQFVLNQKAFGTVADFAKALSIRPEKTMALDVPPADDPRPAPPKADRRSFLRFT